MRLLRSAPPALAIVVLGLVSALSSEGAGSDDGLPDLARLQRMTARFAPADIGADVSVLPASERAALGKMIEAARVMDPLFLRQVSAGNETLLLDLLRDESPLGRARLRYFLINMGPWSRLDGDAPFLPRVPRKPGGANFYPAGAAKADLTAWQKTLKDPERARATGFFTTVRRRTDGDFFAVPYSQEYQGELHQAAERLREAAALTREPTLSTFLSKRADAFRSDDYYESDVAWMQLDSAIEPTIGPYEVYEDEWFGAKAAFQAFITVRDAAETRKLARFSARLQELEDHLPIAPSLRNPKLGALAPIRVVDVVFSAGDGNRGVQTAAYNLPNDERIVAERGTKRVMLKNIQEAKFEKVLLPISGVALSAADQKDVTFEAFFTHILMHELMHGLGPHNIQVEGRATTVRQELQDAYSALEEAKADVAGLWALQYLVDGGGVEKSVERTMYKTFLASTFRSIRFGLTEAHGKAVALQLNALIDKGAFRVGADGTFSVEGARIRSAVTELAREIMEVQAAGSYAKAKALLDRYARVGPEAQRVLDRLTDVPVDIAPRFVTAEDMSRR